MNALKNDRFLKACHGKSVEQIPVWMMRQAGRCLPQYHEIRKDHSFMDILETPELAAEVTVMPVDVLDVDAAILFSDILAIPQAMGMNLSFQKGKGPVFEQPIRSQSHISSLQQFDPNSVLPEMLQAIRRTKERLNDRVPLIGFTGAPWTLACYMIEGGSSRKGTRAKSYLYDDTDDVERLMDRLKEHVVKVLSAQIDAGVDAVQLFDTSTRVLPEELYCEHVLPKVQYVFDQLQSRDVPTIYFSRGTDHSLDHISRMPIDVMSLDWKQSLLSGWKACEEDVVIQGNLDPSMLLTSPETIQTETHDMLDQIDDFPGYVANLGHGVLPDTPLEHTKTFVNTVHDYQR